MQKEEYECTGRGRSKQSLTLGLLQDQNFSELSLSSENKEKDLNSAICKLTPNDIRMFTGSLNFSEKILNEAQKFSEIQSDSQKLENHIRSSLNKVKSYHSVFDSKTIFVLKMLIAFSDNLKNKLDLLNNTFMDLKLSIISVMANLENSTVSLNLSRNRRNTEGLGSLAEGLKNINIGKTTVDGENKLFQKSLSLKMNYVDKKYPNLHEDEKELKEAKKELKNLLGILVEQTNQVLELVDSSYVLYEKQSGKLSSKNFIYFLKLAKILTTKFTTEASNLIRLIKSREDIESFNSNSDKNLAIIEFKICNLMRLFWSNLNENYLGHLFKLKDDFSLIQIESSSGHDYWELLNKINDLSSAIFLGNKDYLIQNDLLLRIASFDIKKKSKGIGFDLNFYKFFHDDDIRFLKNWFKKNLQENIEKKKDLSNEKIKEFFYSYTSHYTNNTDLICSYVKRVQVVREPGSKSTTSGILLLDVKFLYFNY